MAPKRGSIIGLFPGMEDLSLGESSSAGSRNLPQSTTMSFRGSFCNSFSAGWPSWNSLRKPSLQVPYTIRLSNRLRELAKKQDVVAVENTIPAIRNLSQEFSAARNDAYYEALERDLITTIFGSNYIEEAGTSLDITIKLARGVLRGESVPVEIEERSPEYLAGLKDLRDRLKISDPTVGQVIRSRREVIQHTKALNFMINSFVDKAQPLTENLIREAHLILCEGSEIENPGLYRDFAVGVRYGHKKTKKFIHHRAIASYMAEMINSFNDEVLAAERSQTLDPYILAARICHKLVNIHPFADGNGRISRIVMNVILLKYAGHVVAFGENGDLDRTAYLDLAARATDKFREEDNENVEQVGHVELGSFILERSVRKLGELLQKLRNL